MPNRTHPPIEDYDLPVFDRWLQFDLFLINLFFSLFFLQTEDIIDDIIQYQSGSYKLDSSYGGDFQIKQEPLHLTDQEKKERTKKDNHNQSE